MIEFGLRSSGGRITVGPGWICIADVIMASHGLKVKKMYAQLVYTEDDGKTWKDWPHYGDW